MKKYLFILMLSLGLFWGSQAKAAESPIASTKATEALVDAFSFQTDGTIEVSVDKLTVDNIVIDGDQITVPQVDDAANPTIAFGDGDTGIYELTNDNLAISIAGARLFLFAPTAFEGAGTAGIFSIDAATSSATNPAYTFITDIDTGLGWAGEDQLSLIAGAVEMWRYVEDATDYSYTLFPMLIGTSTILTGTNTYTLALGDNVSFPTLSTNQAAFYNKSGEMFAIDEDENEAQLTGNTNDYPSDMTVSVNYPYVNPRSQLYVGVKTYIAEHRAFELLQDLLRNQGMLQANEFIIKHESFVPIINWEDNQEASRLRREQEIQEAQDRIAQLDAKIAIETEPEKLAELQEQKSKLKIPSSYVKRNPDSQWLISKGVKLQ